MTFGKTAVLSRLARVALILVTTGALAACGLPRSGPVKNELFDASVSEAGNAFIVPVTDVVAQQTFSRPATGFSSSFLSAGTVSPDAIRPGDILGLTIWENVVEGLLARGGAAASVIEQVQVDSAGFIFVPYAGRIMAAGNTPEALRGIITRQLETQTPDPQVSVRRIAGDGATVTVVGNVNGQGVYTIERPTRTLSSMIARAGGVNAEFAEYDMILVRVIRGGEIGTIWLTDLYRDPSLDIALRGGDKIIIEQDPRSFIALGATRGQTRVNFDAQDLTALEALAQVGGLDPNLADPTGVFILRDESEDVARTVLGRPDLQGPQRVVYVLDLTQPNGFFTAEDFMIKDSDTVYVTEAPIARWNKTVSLLFGAVIQPAANIETLTAN
ncbi:putative polysaccharide export protein [Dinoroseobacter shibae DFL 12 = DSM 16493]|uniref:Putative polysaccharide export protein n=1 Tax=Dinoroseobacter shibae (strain DSM 16493 / NCIMB 14021 / DFL 12) TaxID=398580 RepID=A8LR67_DINSH|nr:putative polysaccharide export protein [Dinoroseobacter shibae DFL 12 = DSM 16493]